MLWCFQYNCSSSSYDALLKYFISKKKLCLAPLKPPHKECTIERPIYGSEFLSNYLNALIKSTQFVFPEWLSFVGVICPSFLQQTQKIFVQHLYRD